jgi:hypothetical protein
MSRGKSWRALWVLATVSLVCLVGAGQAEEEAPKEKGKGKKSHIVEVDLNALPKSLAHELKQYLKSQGQYQDDHKGKKGKGSEEKKGKGGEEKKGKKGHNVEERKGEGKKGKGKKDEDYGRGSDLERRLERLTRELEELRRELRRR